LLRFYDYPEPLWRYTKSTNFIEQFFRDLRRNTKVRDHKFPKPESVYKLVCLESEQREGGGTGSCRVLPRRQRK